MEHRVYNSSQSVGGMPRKLSPIFRGMVLDPTTALVASVFCHAMVICDGYVNARVRRCILTNSDPIFVIDPRVSCRNRWIDWLAEV